MEDPNILFHISRAVRDYLFKHYDDPLLDYSQWKEGRLGKKITVDPKTGIKTTNTYLLYEFNRYLDWFLHDKKGEGDGKAERALVVSRMVYVLDLSNNPDYKDYILDTNNNRNLKLRGDICKVNPQKIQTQNKFYNRRTPKN